MFWANRYAPPQTANWVPAILYWVTAIFLAFAVLISFTGNIRGDFYEPLITIPLSVAALFAHLKRSLYALPIYMFYSFAAFERTMTVIYASQSSIFLSPAPTIMALMVLLWAIGQYRPLRKPHPSEPPE